MRASFDTLTDHLSSRIRADEGYTLYLSGESSEFARLNRGRVRQPGCRAVLRDLASHQRWAPRSQTVTLSGNPDDDRARLDQPSKSPRIPAASVDPHLLVAEDVQSSNDALGHPAARSRDGRWPSGRSRGPRPRGNCGFWHHRAWIRQPPWPTKLVRSGFNLDWCLVHDADKAVKASSLASTSTARPCRPKWRTPAHRWRFRTSGPHHRAGAYRAWLTPSALSEILGLHWGGSAKSETGNSPLRRYWSGSTSSTNVCTSPKTSPTGSLLTSRGWFRRPARTALFDAGQMTGAMVSPRSAQEFGRPTTGAGNGESPVSLAMAPGDIPAGEELERLGTGLFIGNLWYTNFSDREACRITGMTRFATFWVEVERSCPGQRDAL